MLAVIFRAEIAQLDEAYHQTADRLRELALQDYGCLEFCAWTEGRQEVAISYWDSAEQISAWKADPEHQQAQRQGQARWYRSYSVQVVEVLREYAGPSPD